jgi:hypothetical protein
MDIKSIMYIVYYRCSGAVHYQQCDEILDMLKLLEHVEEIVYG